MKATHLKGVYNLNPTTMVMKSGSESAREEATKKDRINEGNPKSMGSKADLDTKGVEKRELEGHSAMATRLHHGTHNDGERKGHEDHHHAVRHLKGK
jgi:hypothetical protein